jgi:protein involved in sex pheromone biosynthesis
MVIQICKAGIPFQRPNHMHYDVNFFCYNSLMNKNTLPDKEKFVKAAELRDAFNSIGVVAQAGFEHEELNTPAIDLPIDTVDRAGEISEA